MALWQPSPEVAGMARLMRRPSWARVGLLVALLVMLAAAAPALGQPRAASETRPEEAACFAGPHLDYRLWDTQTQGGGTIRADGALHLSTSADPTYSHAAVYTRYGFPGDFGVQVTCRLSPEWARAIDAPPGHHLAAGLGVWAGDSDAAWLLLFRSHAGGTIAVYSTAGGRPGILAQKAESAGLCRLRVTRRAGRVHFAYDAGGGWADLGPGVALARPVHACFEVHSVEVARAATATFCRYRILSGATTYRPLVWRDSFLRRGDLRLGGWVSDYLAAMVWGTGWRRPGPLPMLKQYGMGWVKVAVRTQSSPALAATPFDEWSRLPWRGEYWSSREYAERILRQAQDAGMKLDLTFYLSDAAAHAGAQKAPAAWAGMSLDDTAHAVEAYCRTTTAYYRAHGLRIGLYEIGNEIQWGILGFRPGDRVKLPPGVSVATDLAWLREKVWKPEAKLLKAAIAGVRAADPGAKVVLHVAGLDLSPGDALVTGFFQSMIAQGVPFDYAGISQLYPEPGWGPAHYSKLCWFQRLNDTIRAIAALGKDVIVCEGAYPSALLRHDVKPMPDYPFTPAGQAAWVRDHLRFYSNNRHVKGFFYFYPDSHAGITPPGLAGPVGLFDRDGQPLPALREYEVNLPPR